jgi:aryl-alcohol dehydrogenase-like predicted oxidoreductase
MCFGAMPNGIQPWLLNEDESRKIINRAIHLGVNFFDTANCYSEGTSEEFLGRSLKSHNRHEIVVATKVFIRMRGSANGQGLSRKNIMTEIDQSLKRLGMDYIDLYIIHRWDYNTPIEETMSALHDLVKAGKVRYLGASAMHAWQFQKAQFTAEKNNLTKFISMQNHYNLIYREEEREMIPLCIDQKIALTPYSPLAGGRLARNWSADTERFKNDKTAMNKYDSTQDTDKAIVKRVAEIAEKHGVPLSHIALSWLRHKKPVASPIVGVTKMSHLEDAVASLTVKLTIEEIKYLEELYMPHRIVGPLSPEENWIHGIEVTRPEQR